MAGGLEEGPIPGQMAKFRGPGGRRKLHMQEAIPGDDLAMRNDEARAIRVSRLARRAVAWFGDQPLDVDWLTLEFKVTRSGMESDLAAEVWRWEIWTK